MQFDFKKIAIIVGIIIVAVVLIIIFGSKSDTVDPRFPTAKTTMQIWGFGQNKEAIQSIADAYTKLYPTVIFNYTQFANKDDYKAKLIDAMASRTGPDIFIVDNNWVYEHWAKMYPADQTLYSASLVSQLYPTVVSQDFVFGQSVYGVPINMDSLALMYNKDIFNAKSVVYPPTTWDEFVKLVPKLKETDENKKITIAGTALGGANNVNNLTDIISVLAFQSGSKIFDGKKVNLDNDVKKALEFYLQFSNPNSPSYTWNDSFGKSYEEFAKGKVAMIIDYYETTKEIKKINPFLSFDVAPIPQLSGSSVVNTSNTAKYLGFSVSKQTRYPYVAWHFIKFASQTATNQTMLEKNDFLPALKSSINVLLSKDSKAVFPRAFLVAKNWPRANAEYINSTFSKLISNVLSGRLNLASAISSAQADINSLYTQTQ